MMAVLSDEREEAFGPAEITVLQTIANQASLAVRNAALYDRSLNLTRDLGRINRSVQNVMYNLDSADAMRIACQTAIEITHAQKAAIYLLESDDTTHIHLAQSVGLSEADITTLQILAYDAQNHDSGPHKIADIEQAEGLDSTLARWAKQGGCRALVEIPLHSGPTPVGILATYHDQPYHHADTELELLETLAYQVTAALDLAELLHALELYASEQAQLVHLSRITSASLNLEQLIANVSEIICQIMDVDHTWLGLINLEKNSVILYGTMRQDQAWITLDPESLLLDDAPELQAVTTDLALTPRILHSENGTLSKALLGATDQSDDLSLAMIPMIAGKIPLGAIFLGYPHSRSFSDGEWRLIEMASNQIATQIHNAQTFSVTQEALGRGLQQLSLIEDIAEQITRAGALGEVINNVLEAAIQATQADIAAIALYDEDTDEFHLTRKEMKDGEQWLFETRVPNVGVISHVHKTGKPMLIPDNTAIPFYVKSSQAEALRSSLVVPLSRDDRVIGALNVESEHSQFFTDEHLGFVQSLAGHAVISIERARLVDELQTGNDRMRAILDATRDGLILLDSTGKLLESNPSASNLLNIDLEERINQNFAEMLLDYAEREDIHIDMARHLRLLPTGVSRREYDLTHRNRPIHVEQTGSPVLDRQGQNIGRLLVLRDITEEKALAAYRDKITRMMIHDLSGPLGSIISSMDFTIGILRNLDNEGEDVVEVLADTLEASLSSAFSLHDLVHSILDIAKLKEGELPLAPRPHGVHELADAAVQALSNTIQNARINVSIVIPDKLPPVEVDENAIRRVFINIIGNALRFTPEGGKIEISARPAWHTPRQILIRIADSGSGIPPDAREKVFEEFQQVDGHRPVRGGKGTGLGLTFCKLAIETHGGRIWVEPESPLPGACFAFTLPIATESPTSKSSPATENVS
jgi:PAS domain S-box-containing protein